MVLLLDNLVSGMICARSLSGLLLVVAALWLLTFSSKLCSWYTVVALCLPSKPCMMHWVTVIFPLVRVYHILASCFAFWALGWLLLLGLGWGGLASFSYFINWCSFSSICLAYCFKCWFSNTRIGTLLSIECSSETNSTTSFLTCSSWF